MPSKIQRIARLIKMYQKYSDAKDPKSREKLYEQFFNEKQGLTKDDITIVNQIMDNINRGMDKNKSVVEAFCQNQIDDFTSVLNTINSISGIVKSVNEISKDPDPVSRLNGYDPQIIQQIKNASEEEEIKSILYNDLVGEDQFQWKITNLLDKDQSLTSQQIFKTLLEEQNQIIIEIFKKLSFNIDVLIDLFQLTYIYENVKEGRYEIASVLKEYINLAQVYGIKISPAADTIQTLKIPEDFKPQYPSSIKSTLSKLYIYHLLKDNRGFNLQIQSLIQLVFGFTVKDNFIKNNYEIMMPGQRKIKTTNTQDQSAIDELIKSAIEADSWTKEFEDYIKKLTEKLKLQIKEDIKSTNKETIKKNIKKIVQDIIDEKQIDPSTEIIGLETILNIHMEPPKPEDPICQPRKQYFDSSSHLSQVKSEIEKLERKVQSETVKRQMKKLQSEKGKVLQEYLKAQNEYLNLLKDKASKSNEYVKGYKNNFEIPKGILQKMESELITTIANVDEKVVVRRNQFCQKQQENLKGLNNNINRLMEKKRKNKLDDAGKEELISNLQKKIGILKDIQTASGNDQSKEMQKVRDLLDQLGQ